MRILQVVPTYLPARRHGGPVFAVHGLARALLARGHEVQVFTTNLDGRGSLDVPDAEPVSLDGVRVRYFAAGWPRRLHRAPGMASALRAEAARIDVMHLHSLFLWPTLIAARVAEAAGVPYFVSPRGMLVAELIARRGRLRKTLWLRLFERRTLSRARGLVATSSLEAREIRGFGWALPPIHVVPNGIDAAPFAGAPTASLLASVKPAANTAPYLLFLGRISWKKGLDRLIAALPRVPQVSLVIAGPDDEGLRERLVSQAAAAGVAARIRFVGETGDAPKVALLQGAAALVAPSLSENFGNVVLEAMAAGCPVAVTRGVGLADEVVASGAGAILPDEATAMGDALAALLSDTSGLAAMRRAGPPWVSERFSWEHVAARMESVYRGEATAEPS